MLTCTLITYSGLGLQLSPVFAFFAGSGMFLQKPSPTSEYVLVDLYGCLMLILVSHSYATTPTATHIGVNKFIEY
jgi:hypothetical protein